MKKRDVIAGVSLKTGVMVALIILLGINACTSTPADIALSQNQVDPRPALNPEAIPAVLPTSMKGYELYSWQAAGEWVYTLVTGTNRIKTREEITSTDSIVEDGGYLKISVDTLEDLKELLKRLPDGEVVTWSIFNLKDDEPEGTLVFTFPPVEILQEMVAFAEENGILLQVPQIP